MFFFIVFKTTLFLFDFKLSFFLSSWSHDKEKRRILLQRASINNSIVYSNSFTTYRREATIFYASYVSLFNLPTPVEDHMHNKNVFSEERAWRHLKYFDSTGYNILGTYSNEVLVPSYIMKELEKLKHNKFNWTVEVDVLFLFFYLY